MKATVKNMTIIRYANAAIARFETIAEDEPNKGRRVKHYVYQDNETRAFWHERRYLVSKDVKPIHNYDIDISDRVFWGKVRLLKHRDACLPETWAAIAIAIENIERIKIRESHE